jgi:hypothetical protein
MTGQMQELLSIMTFLTAVQVLPLLPRGGGDVPLLKKTR